MKNTTETNGNETRLHVFERAGLGLAPFTWVDVEERRGPITISDGDGVTTTVGAPGQPMGSCDFCGTGIVECHQIRSSDGKNFIVGCECVKKTGDRGLVKAAQRAANKIKKEKRHAREDARISAAKKALDTDAVRQALESQPHPQARHGGFFADLTALDFVVWMFDHAGRSGMVTTARTIERIQKDA